MRSVLFFPILLLLATMAFAQQPTTPNPADYQNSARPGLIENLGQVATPDGQPRPDVLFTGHGNGMQLFVFGNGISYQFTHINRPEPPISEATGQPLDRNNPRDRKAYDEWERENTTVSTHRVHVELVNANPHPEVIKQAPTGYYENHYLAHCEVTGAKSYAQVTFKDVYPGIDWVLYRTGEYLKYDFVVHPGADPAQIQLAFTGADGLDLLPDGSLEIATTLGTVQENAPVSWYGEAKTPVESAFVLENDTLHFALGEYDNTQPLTIDPTLLWGTYYGGSDWEEAYAVAVGPSGAVYLAGWSESPTAIATAGSHQPSFGGGTFDGDAFLAKFDSSGTRLWGTYYGGSDNDYGHAVTVGPSGAVYLAGETRSTTAIATAGSHKPSYGGGVDDVFLAKFNSSGTRLWGTYYGGSSIEIQPAIAVGPSGVVYLAGETKSATAIATPGSHQPSLDGSIDGFLAKFDSSGTRLWGTYYGGSHWDQGYALAVGPAGAVYLAGETWSPNAIATLGSHQASPGSLGGSRDAFLAKFDSSGTRLWGTYYGGDKNDWVWEGAIAVDPSGAVYLAGQTESTNAIATPGSHQPSYGGGMGGSSEGDAFLVKFDSSGNRQWGTYFGGSDDEERATVAVGPAGAVYLTGWTSSTTAIATPGSHQPSYGGGYQFSTDAFLAKFNNSGARLWGTYYGGNGIDEGLAVAVGPAGAVYLAGRTTSNTSSNAIATPGSHQPSFGGISDAFLAKLVCVTNATTAALTACDSYTWPANGQTYTTSGSYTTTLLNAVGCDSVVTLNLTINNSTSSTDSITVCNSYTWPANGQTYTTSGSYSTTLTNAVGCDSVVTLNLTVNANSASETVATCESYTWPTNGQTYTSSGTYTTTFTNQAGCDSVLTLNLTINNANTGSETVNACESYTWPANGQTYTSSGTYTTTITNQAGCDSVVTLNLTINTTDTTSIDTAIAEGMSVTIAGTSYDTVGTFVDTLTNAAGCDSVLIITITSAVGLEDALRSTLPFTLHPNPTTGEVNITGDFRPGQPLQLRVLDLNGRVVQEEELNTPSTHLDLPAGVYIIEVRQGEQLGREKVVLR